jgi:hypothetical protein
MRTASRQGSNPQTADQLRQKVSGVGAPSYSYASSSQSGPIETASYSSKIGGGVTSSLLKGADMQAEQEAFLKYAIPEDGTLVSGSSDYGILAALRDAILKLKADYFSRTGSVVIKG